MLMNQQKGQAHKRVPAFTFLFETVPKVAEATLG
jgi:hypothetical protein